VVTSFSFTSGDALRAVAVAPLSSREAGMTCESITHKPLSNQLSTHVHI